MADGGGIFSDGQEVVIGAAFRLNQAGTYGGGLFSDDGNEDGGPMTRAAFRHERAGLHSGSIFNQPEDDALIGDDSFAGNFTGQSSATYGGGIYNESDSMDIGDVTFTGNSSAHGGGFYNETGATLTGTTFTKNRAGYGGGIYNDDDLTVADSRIATNTATIGGGGIYNDVDLDITLTNTSAVSNHPDNCEPLNTITGCTN